MPQYDNRSNVIPFQVPDIAKTAYEQSYGQRQTERKERAGRKSDAQQETEGLVEDISMLPVGWTGTPILQAKLDRVMDLGMQYEQNPDVYDEFRKEKEEFEALVKQSQGAFTFYNKQNLEATKSPFDYKRNEEAENSFLRGDYTNEDDLRSALLPENVTAAAPKEVVKPPKYLDPLNALDLFSSYTGKGMGEPTPVGSGYKMVYTEKDKTNIFNSIKNTFMSDPEFRNSVIFYDKAKSDKNFALGEATDEMIQETMRMYASDETMRDNAIKRYYNDLLPSMEAKLDADQYASSKTSSADKENKGRSATEKERLFIEMVKGQKPQVSTNGNYIYNASNLSTTKITVSGAEYTLGKVIINPKTKEVVQVVLTPTDAANQNIVYDGERAQNLVNNEFGVWSDFVTFGGTKKKGGTQQTQTTPKKKTTTIDPNDPL